MTRSHQPGGGSGLGRVRRRNPSLRLREYSILGRVVKGNDGAGSPSSARLPVSHFQAAFAPLAASCGSRSRWSAASAAHRFAARVRTRAGAIANEKAVLKDGLFVCSPARVRTTDPVVNSHLLCQLSYRGMLRYQSDEKVLETGNKVKPDAGAGWRSGRGRRRRALTSARSPRCPGPGPRRKGI